MRTFFLTIPQIGWILGGKKPIKSILLASGLWYFILLKKLFASDREQEFPFEFNGISIPMTLCHPMDIAVLKEIFILKEYEWCPVQDPKTIIDLGAHFGDTTLYYHSRFPKANIIAVEPAPDTFERLVKNTANIKNITVVQAAISDHDGQTTLNLMPSSLGNSMSVRKETTSQVPVKTLTLRSLLQLTGLNKVDLVKFDIEGAEFLIFKDGKLNTQIGSVIGELHFDLIEGQNMDSFKNNFFGFNFESEEIQSDRCIIKGVNLNYSE